MDQDENDETDSAIADFLNVSVPMVVYFYKSAFTFISHTK